MHNLVHIYSYQGEPKAVALKRDRICEVAAWNAAVLCAAQRLLWFVAMP